MIEKLNKFSKGKLALFIFGVFIGSSITAIFNSVGYTIITIAGLITAFIGIYINLQKESREANASIKKQQNSWDHLVKIADEIEEYATSLRDELKSNPDTTTNSNIIRRHKLTQERIKDFSSDTYKEALDVEQNAKVRVFLDDIEHLIGFGATDRPTTNRKILEKCDRAITGCRKFKT